MVQRLAIAAGLDLPVDVVTQPIAILARRGAGKTYTQRAAVLNKNVLTQTEVLVVMQTTGPQDRAAIDDWIEGNGTREERDEVLGSLASMERGEAWVWSPAFLRILQRVRIRERRTFDSSRTPAAGEARITPTTFAAVDLEALGARIAATREQARANDPAALRKRIQQLEAESKARLGIIERRPEPEIRVERVEVPVLNGQVGELRDVVRELAAIGDRFAEVGVRIMDRADAITTAIDRVAAAPRPAQEPPQRARPPAGVAVRPRVPEPPEASPPSRRLEEAGVPTLPASSPLERDLKAPERAILVALAQYPQGRTQQQVSLLSGYSSTSGSFFGALASLKRDGLIEGTASQFRATGAGVAALGDAWAPLPTGRDLVDYWLARLKPPERAVLGALIEVWPDTLTQAEVAERSGYSGTSGSFFGALAKLRKLDLIVGGAPALRASDDIAEHA